MVANVISKALYCCIKFKNHAKNLNKIVIPKKSPVFYFVSATFSPKCSLIWLLYKNVEIYDHFVIFVGVLRTACSLYWLPTLSVFELILAHFHIILYLLLLLYLAKKTSVGTSFADPSHFADLDSDPIILNLTKEKQCHPSSYDINGFHFEVSIKVHCAQRQFTQYQ